MFNAHRTIKKPKQSKENNACNKRATLTRVASGFTLIELLLVLGVAMILSVLAIQKLVSEQNRTVAKAVGEQMQQIGEATNAYIIAHYREIVGIIPSSTTGLDCGDTVGVTPTGSDPARTCTVSIQAMVDEGFLPTGYPQTTSFDPTNQWQIRLRMANLVPPFNVEGLLISQNPWVKGDSAQADEALAQIEAEKIGIAIRTGGPDAGAVNLSVGANVPDKLFESFGGSFSLGAVSNVAGLAGFPEIRQQGQIGMRLGSASTAMSSYARRDGSAPFTGNLDMGGNDVVNANNISTSGSVSAAGNVNAGNDVNAAGDVTTTNLYAADSVNAINSINAQQVNSTVSVNTPAMNLQGGSLVIGMANDSIVGGTGAFGTATPAEGAISFGQFFDRSTGSSSERPRVPIKNEDDLCNAPVAGTTFPSIELAMTTSGIPLTCQEVSPGRYEYKRTRGVQRVATVGETPCVTGETALNPDTGNVLTCQDGAFRESVLKMVTDGESCQPGEFGRDANGDIYTCKNNQFVLGAVPQIRVVRGVVGSAEAYCGPGETIVGGSCQGRDVCSGADSSAYGGRPDFTLNRFVCATHGCTSHTAYATCMRGSAQYVESTAGVPLPPPAPPVNGSCGSAAGQATASPPSSNLCSVGTTGGVSDSGNNYTWSCNGQNGGFDASCIAPKPAPITPGPTNGQCGFAHGRTYNTSPPVGELCSVGATSTVANNPSTWSWSCGGFNNGATASCVALKPIAAGAQPWTAGFIGQCRNSGGAFSRTSCINSDGSITTSRTINGFNRAPVNVIPNAGESITTFVSTENGDGGQNTSCVARPVSNLNGYSDWVHTCTTSSNGF